MAVETAVRLTAEEYLAWETENEIKHEYIDGEIYDMSGGTLKHSAIAMNTGSAIDRQLDSSDCMVLNSDMRVKVSQSRYVYPDLCAVCGEPELENNETTLLNPAFVVEVTSPTSIDYDRVAKRDFYQQAPSIQTYLIIDQHRVHAEVYTRVEPGWRMLAFSSLEDVISLSTLNCDLPLAQVYRGINMEKAERD